MQPMQPPLVIKQGTSSAPVSMQPGMVTVPMTVNSTMPGSLPNVMTLNKPGGQNVVVTTQNLGTGQPAILPNVQILNMRPGTPSVPAQKSVATVSPRVVIGTPQVVGTRAAAPGITLQTLQSLQPGQQGHLLLKTENGQYQLLRVGPAPATSALAAPPSQTIRLSTVPAHPGVATASTSVAPPGVMPAQLQGMGAPVMHAVASGSGLAPAPPPPPPHQQPTTSSYVKPSDNTKEKCRNFLANLLDLSSKEPPSVEMNVRNLIQELIDVQVEPEEFCDRLERLLNASPQPCLIGFLKKSLPLLRQSLVTKELVIDGIKPPAPHVAFAAPTMPANVQLQRLAGLCLAKLDAFRKTADMLWNETLKGTFAGAAVVDDFVFKVPTKPAPRRKRSLSASSVPKDKQYFLKSEGLATASNATEGTSKVDERYQNFLLAIEKEKAALMTLPLTFAPKEDLSKYTLVSYFQNFLSEENPEQETAIQESVVQDMYLPSEAGQAKATEAAASSKRGSSVIVVSEPIVSTTGTRKKMPLAQEKRLRGKSAGQTAPVQKNLSTLYDSDDESDEYENYFHPGYPYSPANPSGTVNLEFENITRLSLPSIEMTDVEIFEGKRIRHFNNFLNSLAEELKQLPIVVAIRLEAEIQQAVEAAKRLTYENKYISPMSSSTLSRLAGHYDFAGEDDDWYYDDK